MSAKKKIVVVGYGASGSKVATTLAKNGNYEVTVITPYDYMEISLSMTKAIAAGPAEHDKIIFGLLREPNLTIVVGVVSSITDGALTIQSGQTIEFDVCVLATGQKIPIFMPDPSQSTVDARKAFIADLHQKVVRAKSIVIAGSGPIGVELAADIKLRHKDKTVQLVSTSEEVLSMMGPQFRAIAAAELEKRGVQLVLGQRVERAEGGQARLKSGRALPCDLYVPAFSSGGNCAFLPGESRDERNYAVVDDTFKVERFSRVFAIGDCSNYDAVKTYMKIDDQFPVLTANVRAALEGKPLQHHVKGKSFEGKINGPVLVALGHGLDEGFGLGPELPGCMGSCCFCLCGCQTPAGPRANKIKSDFNYTVMPKPGKGISK